MISSIACFEKKVQDAELTRMENSIEALETEEGGVTAKIKAAGSAVELTIPLQHQLEGLKSRRERIRELYRAKTGGYPVKPGAGGEH